jgi:hypothetical protein
MDSRSITFVTLGSLSMMHYPQGGASWVKARFVSRPFDVVYRVSPSVRFAAHLASLDDGCITGSTDIHHETSAGHMTVRELHIDSPASYPRVANNWYVRYESDFCNTSTLSEAPLRFSGSSDSLALIHYRRSGRSTASSAVTSCGVNDPRHVTGQLIPNSPPLLRGCCSNWTSSGHATFRAAFASMVVTLSMPAATLWPWKSSKPSKQRPSLRHFLLSGNALAFPGFSKWITSFPSGAQTDTRGASAWWFVSVSTQGSRSFLSPKENLGAMALSNASMIPMTRASSVDNGSLAWHIFTRKHTPLSSSITSTIDTPNWANKHPTVFTPSTNNQSGSGTLILARSVDPGKMAALASSDSRVTAALFDSSQNGSPLTQRWSTSISSEQSPRMTTASASTTKAAVSKSPGTQSQRTNYCYTCDATSM